MIICVYCQKGGHNKTTACINLAVCFARDGRQGIVVDLDSHQRHSMLFEGSISGVTFQDFLPAIVPEGHFVIIDTSPHVMDEALKAMEMCDLVLIPCLPTPVAVDSVLQSLVTVRAIHARRPEIGALAFFTTMDEAASSKRMMARLKEKAKWPVSEITIPERKHEFKEAYEKKSPVKAGSPAGRAYLALAKEIEDLF